MTQLATEAIGAPFSRPLNVSDMNYAYEVDNQTGMCAPVVKICDLDDFQIPLKDMGETAVCPVATGACVASTTGGLVKGWDMYGQYIEETVGAAGTSTIAFAGVTESPADATWANQYGLPYAYSAAAAVPNADVTITAPDPAEDSRGTFAFGGTLVDTDPYGYTEVEVPYLADRTALFGAPYHTRFASPAAVAADTFAATIDDAGAIAITTTLVADSSTVVIFQFPDGSTVTAANGAGTVNHTLSPLWMSKYARNIADDDAALDKLVRAATNVGTHVIVNMTGSLMP